MLCSRGGQEEVSEVVAECARELYELLVEAQPHRVPPQFSPPLMPTVPKSSPAQPNPRPSPPPAPPGTTPKASPRPGGPGPALHRQQQYGRGGGRVATRPPPVARKVDEGCQRRIRRGDRVDAGSSTLPVGP